MMREMSRVACFMPMIGISGTVPWSRGRSRRPAPAAKESCRTTAGRALLCTIPCAFCGKMKHYEDKCYHKQRLSAKLKSEDRSGKGSGKGNNDQESGKGKPNGRRKGQEEGKGG